ncbi:sialate O-acetylesterase [Klebsiella quasipneumoniae]|uniref:sialate O-acetylesterase n=1 Tax=Klebsiella quasipneumoniae TaxID=1463165 RepID=UPI003D30F151
MTVFITMPPRFMTGIIITKGMSMTDITETGKWEGNIPFITRSDRVEGGKNGLINIQAGRLANRTAYLKEQLDAYNGLLKSGELPFTSEADARAAIAAGKIPVSAIFSIRSTNPYFWVDEYQNTDGQPVATGRHLPGNLLTAPTVGVTASDPDGTLAGLSVTQEGQYFLVINGTDLTYYVNESAAARVALRIAAGDDGETAALLTALEMLASELAMTAGDMTAMQTVINENRDALSFVLTACEMISQRVANVPDDIAQLLQSVSFSLDVVLNSLFTLNKYNFNEFITAKDIPATIKPVGQLTFIPAKAAINVFISYGQSLSNGGGAGNVAISTTQPYNNLTYGSGPTGTIFTATKPLVESGPETICSGMSNYASLSMLRDDGVRPEDHVIFSGAPGRGSTSIAALSKGGAAWEKFENFVKNIPTVNPGKSCALHAVSYLQGENNQDPDRTPYATYLAALLQLQVDITELAQSALGQKTPVYMLTYQHSSHTRINNSATQRAFIQAERQSDYFTLVTPTYAFPHNADTIHLTSFSYKWLAAYFARAYKQLVIERRKPDNVFPMGATWSGNEVRVKLRAPKPLQFKTDRVPQTTNYGFKTQVPVTGENIGINSIVMESDDTVLITLSSTPTVAPIVRYGMDYLAPGLNIVNGASGNLFDSTTETCVIEGVKCGMEYPAPAFELQSITTSF